MSVRDANIVRQTNRQTGIYRCVAPNFELFSASPVILNCLVYNYGLQGKLRRLWRLAVAPQPPIAGHQSRSAEPAAHTQSARICGCVTMARRHSLLSLHCKLIYYLTAKQDYSPNPFNALSAALLTASLAFLFASFTFSAAF